MPEISVPADQVFTVLESNILVDGFHIVVDLDRSHGSTMVDALEGREYVDCYSFFSTLACGHNHPKMQDAGFQRSLLKAALTNPANSDVYCREFAGFVQTFRKLAAPEEFRYLFFVAGGTLAVENAMKAAFDWKRQKNRARGVDAGGDRILHFEEAFHGRSGYTLSVTGTEAVKIRDYPKFDWPRVSNPKLHFPVDEGSVRAAEDRSITEIEAAFAADPLGIAAILIEPVQGEGGDNHFSPRFLARLRQLADQHEALLIFDEVQTGMGTTGRMWAFQTLGVIPDLVAFGKKTQVCGMMSTRRIDEVEQNVFRVSSRINSTWGGNLVDMVRCARYLEIMAEERLVDNAARIGALFLEELRELERRAEAVTNTRGLGLMLAFDLPDASARNEARMRLWNAGLATLGSGPRSIRFRPPLVFGEDDVAATLRILHSVLAA